jgi:hypothetical protein
MLQFEKTTECYRIIETIFAFEDTKTTIVEYKLDLTQKRVNNDPWRKR